MNEGYWRSGILSDEIHECLDDAACLGDDGSTDEEEIPYQCAKGHSGNLCTKCIEEDGKQFQRTGDHGCGECIAGWLNALRILGLLLLIAVFFIGVIFSNMRTKKDSTSSILMRIMTNYVQIVTSAASFNLTFPRSIQSFFDTVKTVGESAKVFLSLDCFITDFGMVQATDTTEYFKALITALLPLFFLLLTVIFWFIMKFILRHNWKKMRNNMVLTMVICMFMVHPTITGMAAGLFNCYEIDEGETWLYKELSLKCWNNEHKMWALGLGIPMLIAWVAGLPFVGFLLVRHNKAKLDDQDVIFKYRFLYQGYKTTSYYWEFINIFRKVAMVLINTFLAIYPPIYKVSPIDVRLLSQH